MMKEEVDVGRDRIHGRKKCIVSFRAAGVASHGGMSRKIRVVSEDASGVRRVHYRAFEEEEVRKAK